MNSITNHTPAPITETPVTAGVNVITQGPDFAVVNINLPGFPDGGVDLDAQELAALIVDLQQAAQVLEDSKPVPYLLAM